MPRGRSGEGEGLGLGRVEPREVRLEEGGRGLEWQRVELEEGGLDDPRNGETDVCGNNGKEALEVGIEGGFLKREFSKPRSRMGRT